MTPTATPTRVEATRAALLDAALHEFSALGHRRCSMEGVARRAGVSRATLYLHWKTKDELFRALVQRLHDEHLAALAAVVDAPPADPEAALVGALEARFLRWVELTSRSPFAAELYDLHGRLCGEIARASQERSEKLLTKLLRDAQKAGRLDLGRSGLSAARVAGVLFDCAHGAKGEDPSLATPQDFRARLQRIVRVLVAGLEAPT